MRTTHSMSLHLMSEIIHRKEANTGGSKAVVKNIAILTGKHQSWNLFLIKAAGLKACNFIKKRLQFRYIPVNIAKFLRTLF